MNPETEPTISSQPNLDQITTESPQSTGQEALVDQSITQAPLSANVASSVKVTQNSWKKIAIALAIFLLIIVITLIGLAYFGIFSSKPMVSSSQLLIVSPSPIADNLSSPTVSPVADNSQSLGQYSLPLVQSSTPSANPDRTYVRAGNIWVDRNGSATQITNDVNKKVDGAWLLSDYSYYYPALSPAETYVAYFKWISSSPQTTELWLANTYGSNKQKLFSSEQLNAYTHPLWINETEVLVDINADDQQAQPDQHNLVKINVQTGTQQVLTSYVEQSGCGGGSPDPTSQLVRTEGATGRYYANFKLSPNNKYVLHPISCTGAGFGLYNLQTQSDSIVSENDSQPQFSADSSQIAATSGGVIDLFDSLSGKKIKTLATEEQANALIWSEKNDSLFYSSSHLVKELQFSDVIAKKLFYSSPVTYADNQTSIRSIAIIEGKDTLYQKLDAYGVRPIQQMDQDTLLLALVQNPVLWFTKLNQGSTPNPDDYPTVDVFKLNLKTGFQDPYARSAEQMDILGE